MRGDFQKGAAEAEMFIRGEVTPARHLHDRLEQSPTDIGLPLSPAKLER
jgi:hypothetical protein